MGKKDRQDAKVEREEGKKADDKKKLDKADDDAWKDDGKASKSKSKKEDEERKKAEQNLKKAEAKKLLEEEEAVLAKPKAKSAPVKVTQHQRDAQKEEEAKKKEAALKNKDLASKREMTEDDYANLVSTENRNRVENEVEARNVAEALSVLGVNEMADPDKHPEKRMRAAWLAYEETNLPVLKQEKKGLKLSQYKDMLWRMWAKASENPMNQAGRSG